MWQHTHNRCHSLVNNLCLDHLEQQPVVYNVEDATGVVRAADCFDPRKRYDSKSDPQFPLYMSHQAGFVIFKKRLTKIHTLYCFAEVPSGSIR
jgi:hypothetical protein